MYRDDGLACFENVCGPQVEKIRKDVIKIFKQEFDFNVTGERNLEIVSFLDVTFQWENISLIKNRTVIPYILMLTPPTHQTLPKISPIAYQSEYLKANVSNHLMSTFSTAQKSFITTL